MPWVPVNGALRTLRTERRLEIRELARCAGIREQTIYLHESDKAPGTMRHDTVMRIAKALGCPPESFVRWQPPGIDSSVDPNALPRLDTLTGDARDDAALGGPTTVKIGAVSYMLLRPTLLYECKTACAIHSGHEVVIVGRVEAHRSISAATARILSVGAGAGAGFLLGRRLSETATLFATVYTNQLEHTRALLGHFRDRQKIVIIARVFVPEPTDGWGGFSFIEDKVKEPRPFAFVAERILTGEGASTA
jgi:transcriptional regulator with XRE-family HTH domain